MTGQLTAQDLRDRLGAVLPPIRTAAPRATVTPLPPRPSPAGAVPAAVLVPIITGPNPAILLTKRTAHLRKHAGQVSFPGGRMDPEDATPEAAALRETWEEIGLQAGSIELVGRMADYVTGTGYRVTPVIGLVPPGAAYHLNEAEVDQVFELPLSVVMDPAAPRREQGEWGGRAREFWVWPHPEHYIWGATAAILVGLADLLRGA